MICERCGWPHGPEEDGARILTVADVARLPAEEREFMLAALTVNWRAQGCGLMRFGPMEGMIVLSRYEAAAAPLGEVVFHLHGALVADHAAVMDKLQRTGRIDAAGRPVLPA